MLMTQLYLKTSPSPSAHINTCLEDIRAWMKQNFLQQQQNHSPITHLTGKNIPLSSNVYNLGIKLDSSLTFDNHIKHHSYHQEHCQTPSHPDAERLFHAFVTSRLDNCNALCTLHGHCGEEGTTGTL
jgi:hypothetical protein